MLIYLIFLNGTLICIDTLSKLKLTSQPNPYVYLRTNKLMFDSNRIYLRQTVIFFDALSAHLAVTDYASLVSAVCLRLSPFLLEVPFGSKIFVFICTKRQN